MNYYEKQYQELSRQGNPLMEIVEILLYRSSLPKLPDNIRNKFQLFWQSAFIDNLTAEHLCTDNYRIAFAQYLRYGGTDVKLYGKITDLCPESFIRAVRYSGIVSDLQYTRWQTVTDFCRFSPYSELHDFVEIAEFLRNAYRQRLNEYCTLKSKLNLSQLEIMLYGSLYTYEHLLPDSGEEPIAIPYQIDHACPVSTDKIWAAFDTFIRQTLPSKKTVTEKSLALLFRNKLMPFLLGEGLTQTLIYEYDQFKYLTALRVELDLFRNFVFNAYCYQEKTEYVLHQGEVQLSSSGRDEASEYWLEKFSVLQMYWQWRGMQSCIDTPPPHIFRVKEGENLENNLIAISEAQGIVLRLQEVFGIHGHASAHQSFDLFDAVLSLELSQQFYRQAFTDEFTVMRQEGIPPFQALALLMFDGLATGENRLPIAFAEKKHKAERMSDWILSGSRAEKKKSMTAILDFWSQDLRDMKRSSYQELPYYQTDGLMLELPHRFGLQNLHTTVINHFRRLNKNRPVLKKETSLMEIQLADLFEKHGWQVLAQHEPEDVGIDEIDLVVIADNHVLVLELKSSFVKSTVREIYEYRFFVLKKAAYQLNRKCRYVKEKLLPKLGYSPETMRLHSWIADTTLEFDHQYIDGHLKISLEELLIHLNGHAGFAEFFLNSESLLTKSPVTFATLLDDVEVNRFWQTELARYPEMLKMLKQRYS